MNGPDGEHWDGCNCEDCTPKLLPPDTRDPITRALGLLAVRYGSDSSPIVEARAELARLRTPAPPPPATDQHEPKEPRPAPTREEFEENVRRIIHGTVGASTSDLAHSLLAAFDALAAERDAALKRCDKLEAFITYIESPALKAWRALSTDDRKGAIDEIRLLCLNDTDVAAACLEAVGEPRP